MSARAHQIYWLTWALATGTTGIVAGFFLGHALLLGRFVDWLLISGRANVLATTYPLFRGGDGKIGFDIFYAVAMVQILAAVAFAIVSWVTRRRWGLGIGAGIAGVAWPIAHYASGFAAVEATVLRSTTPATREIASQFIAWNGEIHVFYVVALLLGLTALLIVPLSRPSN